MAATRSPRQNRLTASLPAGPATTVIDALVSSMNELRRIEAEPASELRLAAPVTLRRPITGSRLLDRARLASSQKVRRRGSTAAN